MPRYHQQVECECLRLISCDLLLLKIFHCEDVLVGQPQKEGAVATRKGSQDKVEGPPEQRRAHQRCLKDDEVSPVYIERRVSREEGEHQEVVERPQREVEHQLDKVDVIV